MAYLKAKNAPITKPGIATISDIPIKNDKKIAKIPQLSEPIITIIIAGFVAAKSNLLLVCPCNYKSHFLSACSKGIKRDWHQIQIKEIIVQIVAVGSRVFVTSFQLAGVKGVKVESPAEALTEINKMDENSGIGLVLLSDDIGKDIRYQLTSLRAKRPIPLIFELPSPGSKKEKVDYRALLKQILGV